jgi:hypothetical protein
LPISIFSTVTTVAAFAPNSAKVVLTPALNVATSSTVWFAEETKSGSLSTEQLKAQVLQLGAALDRGQAYNPTSGVYYSGTMSAARSRKIEALVEKADPDVNVPKTLKDIEGEWELVLTTVPHGICRSSPLFFLAVQEAFTFSEEKGK